MTDKIPIWFQPTKLEAWATRPMKNNIVYCYLHFPRIWEPTPEMNETPQDIEHIFRGVQPTEWLIIKVMEQADPSANLRDWLEVILGLTGFPILPIAQACAAPPTLLQWDYYGPYSDLTEQLEVDETHVYHGLANLGESSKFAGLYVLLARRKTRAWQVALSLTSNYSPGASTDAAITEDHMRAGATLGNLRFF